MASGFVWLSGHISSLWFPYRHYSHHETRVARIAAQGVAQSRGQSPINLFRAINHAARRARRYAPTPLAVGGTPRPPHPLGRRHGRGVFFWGFLACGRWPFFLLSAGWLVWLSGLPCFVFWCPSGCLAWLLCFPVGSVLLSGFWSGWGGLALLSLSFFSVFPNVDKYCQFVDYCCIFADNFVPLYYN